MFMKGKELAKDMGFVGVEELQANADNYRERLRDFDKVKKEGKILTIKEYIHFIQIKFPNIIQEEIETILEHNKIESVKKEIFESRRSNGEFKLPLFLETIDKNLYEFFIEEFNQKSQEELSALKEYYRGLNYKENRELRDDKHNYFQKIQELNRMVNGKVQSVIQFIDNLKYYL